MLHLIGMTIYKLFKKVRKCFGKKFIQNTYKNKNKKINDFDIDIENDDNE